MQKTKKTKKVVQAEEKPVVEEKEKMETEDEEEDEEEDESSDEETENKSEGDEAKNGNKPEAATEDGPPAKKLKKSEKKLAAKETKELTEEELFKQKIVLKGDIIRAGKCSKDEVQQQLQELRNLLGGKYKKYVFNHVISRVIEWMIKLSEPSFTTKLVNDFKDQLILMSKKKYATHVVRCLIEKADKPTFQILHAELSKEVMKMLTLDPSSGVISDLYKKSSNDQKQAMRQNFYGNSFKIFKTKEVNTLKEISQMPNTEKEGIFNEINDNLIKVIEKNGFTSEITVSVLRDYIELVEAGSAKHTALITTLQAKFPDLSEHKEGAWLAAHCLWHSSAKERKQIMKQCKEKLKAIAMSNVGSLMLMAMMDCIDDTTLLNKIILQPLMDDCVEVSGNNHGVRVLAFAVRPRSTNFMHPEQIKFLDEGVKNTHSKKDATLRQTEIKGFAVPAVASVVSKDLSPWIKDPHRFLFMKALLENSDFKEVKEVLNLFSTKLSDPEHKEINVFKGNENTLPMIELPFAQKLVMHLIKEEKGRFSADSNYKPVICEILVSRIKDHPELWLSSNRGVLTFLCMMETEIPSIVSEVKQMVAPHLKLVQSMTDNKNAAGLLKLIEEKADGKKKK